MTESARDGLAENVERLRAAPPTFNTTYTSNQFFDVVLPHARRAARSASSPTYS
jgi:hypothetical protein